MTTRLAAGDAAPAFTLPDADGREVSLADFAGRTVIVYFYPAAMTPGCTTQAIDFTASAAEFEAAGYAIVGISPDAADRLVAFREKEGISYPLLGDPSLAVLKDYGAYGSKVLYGKEIEGVIRSTFVIAVDDDGAGTVDVAQYNVRAKGHVDKLKRELGIG